MMCSAKCKTYSTRDSHVVTHRSTNLAVSCLCMPERTGWPVFNCLWPYVPTGANFGYMINSNEEVVSSSSSSRIVKNRTIKYIALHRSSPG